MKTHALYCKTCRIRLSAPLTIRSGKDPQVPAPEFKDREPPVERGIAYKSWEPWEQSFDARPTPLEFIPQYWLNPDDLTETIRPLDSRMGGCCGPSGLSGPNQICRCKAEVGTFMDDCFTPRMFIPEPSTTTMREFTGDHWNYE